MPVLSKELIGGREPVEIVAYSDGVEDDAPTEVAWASTTEHGTRTVTMTDTVDATQDTRAEVDTRLAAAARV